MRHNETSWWIQRVYSLWCILSCVEEPWILYREYLFSSTVILGRHKRHLRHLCCNCPVPDFETEFGPIFGQGLGNIGHCNVDSFGFGALRQLHWGGWTPTGYLANFLPCFREDNGSVGPCWRPTFRTDQRQTRSLTHLLTFSQKRCGGKNLKLLQPLKDKRSVTNFLVVVVHYTYSK